MAETTNKSTKVLVRTNDGQETETTIQNYDAAKIAEMLNNQSNQVIAVGDVVVHRSYVTGVRPVVESK